MAIKKFANKVIETQSQEMQLLKNFDERKEVSPGTKQYMRELNLSMAAMMNKKHSVSQRN